MKKTIATLIAGLFATAAFAAQTPATTCRRDDAGRGEGRSQAGKAGCEG
jgi:hypothetical protein